MLAVFLVAFFPVLAAGGNPICRGMDLGQLEYLGQSSRQAYSCVCLHNNDMKGVWDYKIRGSQTVVKVHLFASPTASIRKGIEAEADWLSAFLNTKVVLEFGNH